MPNKQPQQPPKTATALDEIVGQNQARVTKEAMEAALKGAYPEQMVLAFKEVMATDAGKRFLNELTNFYMQKPFDLPGSLEGMGKWRDGQASVLRDLWNMLKIN